MKSFLLIAIFLGLVLQASASSHSEAPGTAKKPSSDITDFYMFKSPTNADNLILALGVSGLQNPNAGPNWYTFSDQHFFEFHLVCDAESVDSAHVFQFYFGSRYNGNGPAVDYPNDYDYSQCGLGQPADTTPSVALDIGSAGDVQSVEIPLKVFLPLYNAQTGAININLINSVESYHFNYYQNVPAPAGSNDFGTPTVVTHGSNNDNTFRVPFTYVGDKTFGQPDNYASYADQFIYTTNNFLTCGNTPESVRVFAGPRQEPFFIDLGRTFDLLNFNPPIIGTGQSGTIRNCPENNDIIQHNVNYIVLEVPICAIECGVSPNVLGAWTAVRELLHNNGNDHVPGAITNRFGNPLINELIIGIGDKQSWNYDHPYNEADFALYYKYPVVPAFINLLFPSVTPPDVPVGGRVDLYELLLKGIPGLNRVNSSGNSLVTVTPSDLLRINLGSVSETNTQSYSALGVIGGDFAGYPNGRRLFDDVVDITLRAAMGALCNNAFNGGFGCFESNAPFWDTAFGDGVSSDPADYLSVFPFVNYPNPGAVANPHPRQCSSASSSAFALMTLFATFFVFLF